MAKENWTLQAEEALNHLGFKEFGISTAQKPVSITFYKEWIRQKHHGKMNYLESHIETKSDPKAILPSVKSIISVAMPYLPHPEPQELPVKHLKVAAYAKGQDYHHWLGAKLEEVCDRLRENYPDGNFFVCVDSIPILEKEWAARNNLGWVGKNSLLLNKNLGSLFFLGEILTSLELDEHSENQFSVPDHCGKCNACIEACPTDAILDNRSLDANKCLAYLNIELNENPAEDLRSKYEGWLFGCDICQEVCPWNKKVFEKTTKPEPPTTESLVEELKYILGSSNKKLQKDFKNTPLSRAGGKGLKRSALAIIGGSKIKEVKDFLLNLHFEQEDLQEMKAWTLKALV